MTPARTELGALRALQHEVESLADFIARVTPKHAPIPPHLQRVVDVLEATRHREVNALISMPPRHGKLVADSTPVLTPRGWRTHGDLEVGDQVFAPDGSVTEVIDRKPDDLATVEVVFGDGAVIKVHEDHLWSVIDRSSGRRPRVLETKELRALGLKGKSGRCRFYVEYTRPIQGVEQSLPFEPYYLGLWLGDGSADASKITAHPVDAQFLVPELEKRGHRIGARWQHQDTGCEQFMVLGDGPKGSGVIGYFRERKHVPDCYFAAPLEQRRDLLRGLVDSDGHVEKCGRVRFVNTNERLIHDVERLAWTLGYRAATSRAEPALSSSGIQGTKPVFTVQWTPHDGERQAWLPRKDIRVTGQRRMRAIVDIRRADPEPGHCIAVLHPSSLYLVGDQQVPTHNTITLAHGLAYRTLYDPACLNFYATFGGDLSVHTSRNIRRIARSAGVAFDPEAQRVDDWRTTCGGGIKATSVGGDVTGRGCNSGLIVADDLVKGREQAESKLARDRTWDWFRDDLMSRLEPGASLIVNSTRWHEDDIIGRLIDDPLGLDWIHIVLPAVINAAGEPADERDSGDAQALWPEQYPLERLAPIRQRGEHGWWSLYQQQPFPRGGIMFDRSWFEIVDRSPAVRGSVVVRGWDLAASTDRDSAATCGVKMRFAEGKIIIEDIVWKQGSPAEVEKLIVSTAEQDGRDVEQSLPQDPGQAGKSQMTYLGAKLHGFKVHFSTETGSKELRAEPLAAQAQIGNVMMVRAPWNDATLAEFASFPVGKMKDRVDASSRAYARIIERPTSALTRLQALGR